MRPKKCVGGASGGQGSSRGRIEELSIRGFTLVTCVVGMRWKRGEKSTEKNRDSRFLYIL